MNPSDRVDFSSQKYAPKNNVTHLKIEETRGEKSSKIDHNQETQLQESVSPMASIADIKELIDTYKQDERRFQITVAISIVGVIVAVLVFVQGKFDAQIDSVKTQIDSIKTSMSEMDKRWELRSTEMDKRYELRQAGFERYIDAKTSHK